KTKMRIINRVANKCDRYKELTVNLVSFFYLFCFTTLKLRHYMTTCNFDCYFASVLIDIFHLYNVNKINLLFKKSLQVWRSEEHTSELQSRFDLVCRLLLEKKKNI